MRNGLAGPFDGDQRRLVFLPAALDHVERETEIVRHVQRTA